MVIYRGPDGKPGYHQTDDIHDAVGFVEQLRNDQGVEHARIFRLEEVGFEYRPYFRVELTGGEPVLSAAPSTPAVSAAPEPLASEPVKEPVIEKVAEAPEKSPEPVATVTAEPEPAPEPGPPTITTPSSPPSSSGSGDNGVGARRGLFGR